jgi:hypothetical protein
VLGPPWSFVTAMLARFIVLLRQLNGLVAGALSMPLTRFVSANVIGAGKTAEGVVEFAAPQVRSLFVSGLRQNLAGGTGALKDLAVELYARG